MASKLSDAKFSVERGYGFSLEPGDGATVFQYTFETQVHVVLLDGSGAQYKSEITSIDVVHGTLLDVKDGILLELVDGARSARRILNDIELILDCPIAVESCNPTIAALVDAFSGPTTVRLRAMRVGGLNLGKSVSASLELRSGDSIEIEDIQLLQGQDYIVESCTLEIFRDGLRGVVSVLPSGLVKASGDLEPYIRHLARQIVASPGIPNNKHGKRSLSRS